MKDTKNIDYWERTLKNPPKAYIKLFKQEEEYLRKNIVKGQKILDIGCGDGRNILSIVDINDDITAVDIDQKAVDDTKKNLKKYPNVSVLLADVRSLPFGGNTFDVVIFSMTLVNLDNDKEKALLEMKRVSKDDASLIISVYSEKAFEERLNMYQQIKVPIKSETNGKFVFDIEGLVSEQFSLSEIKNMVDPLGLRIDNYEEVENLAYILTLKKKQ